MKNEVNSLLDECLGRIMKSSNSTPCGLTLDQFTSSYEKNLAYSELTDRKKLIQIERKIDEKCGVDLRLLYYQATVYRAFLAKVDKMDEHGLPSDVSKYLKEDFYRILDIARSCGSDFLTFNNFQFLSYMEKLHEKCYPVGNHNISVSGVPRRLFFCQRGVAALDFARMLIHMGGNYPLFELHYNPHRFRLFNPEGWREVFLLTAQMMNVKKDIKGVFGASWFYDPAIKVVSPELYYIRELIEEIGGIFWFAGSSEQDKKNAFAMSMKRKTAYQEGRYNPASYMMIIHREVLLRFYD